jgi:hypothetical protein
MSDAIYLLTLLLAAWLPAIFGVRVKTPVWAMAQPPTWGHFLSVSGAGQLGPQH